MIGAARAPTRSSQADRGYTLIELLVVMAVLGVLAALIMPLAQLEIQRQRETELRLALWQIREAIDEYHRSMKDSANPSSTPVYPPDLKTLVDGIPDSRVPGGVRRFLRRIPRDPFADPSLRPEDSWAVRCYLSSAERPQPGADVFDVASRSRQLALDGSQLSSW